MSMSPRLLRPQATGFSPRSISGLALWLDASDTASITLNGNAVSQWSDKSGAGRHLTQGTSNNQPAYTATVNGRNAITFDGNNDVLFRSSTISPTLLSSTAGATALYVFRPNSDTTFTAVSAAGPAVGHLDRFSDGNTYHGNFRNTRFEGVANGLITSTGTQLLASRVQAGPGTHIIRRNKTQIHSGTSDLSAFRSGGAIHLTTGAGVNSAVPTFVNYFNGEACEIIFVAGPMTDAMFSACENYLFAKWGVS